MTNGLRLGVFSLVASTLLSGCFLFGGNTKDPLKDLTLEVSYYDGDTRTVLPSGTTALTVKSNRNVTLSLSDSKDLTRVEVARAFNGASASCTLLNTPDSTVRTADEDWPASDTQYTVTVTTAASSKTFGPYTATVTAAAALVTGAGTMSDQAAEADATCFFQARHVGWGGGGDGLAVWHTYQISDRARILDFATLTTGGQLKAVSPDLIQTTHTFDALVNLCGVQTTTFAAYTGALDPSATTKPTLAEIQALPTPPATATSLALTANSKFMYRTAEGKKGLIKIGTITTTGANTAISISYAAEQ